MTSGVTSPSCAMNASASSSIWLESSVIWAGPRPTAYGASGSGAWKLSTRRPNSRLISGMERSSVGAPRASAMQAAARLPWMRSRRVIIRILAGEERRRG